MKLEQLKKQALEIGIRDFYAYVRNYYLQKHDFDVVEIDEDKKDSLDELVSRTTSFLGVSRENLWENPAFHMAFRITDLEALVSLDVKGIDLGKVKTCLDEGREMSILPLNVLLGNPTIQKFIPDLPKLYRSPDPYDIFSELSKIYAHTEISKEKYEEMSKNEEAKQRVLEKDGRFYEKMYLGSRKFDYAVLANITEFCLVGCAECYKGTLTRIGMAALADISPEYAELKRQLNLQEKRAIKQVSLLKEWLNKHPEVDTVIISGGEPLMYSPNTLEAILNELYEAKNVKAIRICTSAVYQGLFYRINDELLDVLESFQDKLFRESDTANPRILYINAHITDENQLLTPEARLACYRLKKAGITTHLQMPLQEGINFYRDDVAKSAEKLAKICKVVYQTGAIPYKAIVNMHSPSFKELTVPIERVSGAIGFLDGHFDTSDMKRWQAYNILHRQGNAYIYPGKAFNTKKEIDLKRRRVTYFIYQEDPRTGEDSVHTYEEPLLEGINDRDSLAKINNARISSKIEEVRKAYHEFRENKIDKREFYRISGIKFSVNEPLIVGGD